jgi:stress response protein YsnF
MTHTVIGFFRNATDAYHAADVLKTRGFDNNDIDISTNAENRDINEGSNERSGKIGSFFKSLFSDNENDADRYSKAAVDNSLVTVFTSDHQEAEKAANVLDECGAIDVDDNSSGSEFSQSNRGMSYDKDLDKTTGLGVDQDLDRTSAYGYDKNAGIEGNLSDDEIRGSVRLSDDDLDRTNEASIPIVEEEVNVGKREVRRGGVRLHSRIIERPVEETLRLREEKVRVERNPVSREASEADFHEETIEVDEYGEEPIVSKRARVVEEVNVGKEVHERQETVREKARKTEVDIENVEDVDEEDKIRRKNRR